MHHVVRQPAPRRVREPHHDHPEPRVRARHQDPGHEGAELQRNDRGILVPDALKPAGIHLQDN